MTIINNTGCLIKISEDNYPVSVDILYASGNNFTGTPIYRDDACYLHTVALDCLLKAAEFLKQLKLRLKIWDAYRTLSAQKRLFKHLPNHTIDIQIQIYTLIVEALLLILPSLIALTES